MLTYTRRIGTIGLLVVCSAVAVSAALGADGDQPPTRLDPMGASDFPPRQIANVDPALASRFSVFRRAHESGDELPAGTRRALSTAYGQNPALSRAVVTARGRKQFLVPGAGTLGLYDETGGSSVADLNTVMSGAMITTEMCVPPLQDGQIAVAGLLPDGATETALILRDGRQLPVPVVDNVYDVVINVKVADDLPVRVEWVLAGQPGSARVPGADESVLTARCAKPGLRGHE